MKKIITSFFMIVVLASFVAAVFPASTNDNNRDMGWAHVNELSQGPGTVDLEFVSTRGFWSCFEYRTDGDTSQALPDAHYNPEVGDVMYPYFCVNDETEVHTIAANEYVEVRLTFGAEGDERFDWTGFKVGSQQDVPEFGVIGAVLALIGAGIVVYRKRN